MDRRNRWFRYRNGIWNVSKAEGFGYFWDALWGEKDGANGGCLFAFRARHFARKALREANSQTPITKEDRVTTILEICARHLDPPAPLRK